MTNPDPTPIPEPRTCHHGYAIRPMPWGNAADRFVREEQAKGRDVCSCCLASVPRNRMYLDVCLNCAPEAFLPDGP